MRMQKAADDKGEPLKSVKQSLSICSAFALPLLHALLDADWQVDINGKPHQDMTLLLPRNHPQTVLPCSCCIPCP